MWQSAQWIALCTEMAEVNIFAFVYRLFHEDFSAIDGPLCMCQFPTQH